MQRKRPTPKGIADEIRRFDPSVPLARAWAPPASWYTHPDIYRLEQNAVFGSNWIVAARADQLDGPGKYVCGELAGERYVITRDQDGRLHALYNVCRHRAAAVAQGAGTAKRLVCPYHGWTYGLDGRLINAPETDGVEDFRREDFGLPTIAVDTWGPFVFVSLAPNPRSLADDLAELKTTLDETGFESLRFVERRTYTLDCNWKVYVDNYLDGGYHVAYLHKGLAAQLDLASYRTDVFGRFSVQSGGGRGQDRARRPGPAAGSDFPERIGERVVYAWVYPNFMINRYGSAMDTNRVLPLGHARTQVVFDYYFADTEGATARDMIERSISASDVVQREDTDICEAVQRGLESRSYVQGRYSVKREAGEHHFHRLLASDLSALVD